MAALPMEIILSCILPKLPANSLIRFKCVSKTFLAEISSSKFIKQHHHNALSSDSNRLLIIPTRGKLYMYNLDCPQTPPTICRYPKPVTFNPDFMAIVASCECYLLIGCGYTLFDNLILLNPSTRTYRELPSDLYHYMPDEIISGMCHCVDELNDDYKIVRISQFYGADNCEREVMIYSLRSDMWKLIESSTSDEYIRGSSVLLHRHLLHWTLFGDPEVPNYRISRIGCFDLRAEQWTHDVQLPDAFRDSDSSKTSSYSLHILNEDLCCSVQVYSQRYDFWVMKDYGVKESWVKFMTFPIFYDLDHTRYFEEVYNPVAYRAGSPHKLLCIRNFRRDKLFWHDLRDKTSIEAGFHEVDYSNWLSEYVCKGSLMDFPGGQPIREMFYNEDEVNYESSIEEEEEEEEEDDNGDEILLNILKESWGDDVL